MADRDPTASQADALVAEIARQLAQAQAQIAAEAAAEAERILHQGRAKTRARVRQAVDELRAVERRRLQQVRAEIDTERRRRAADTARRLLDAAWPRLAEALERRWRDPAARATWIDATLALAAARLAGGSWTVRHPPGPGVADELQRGLARHDAAAATLAADDTLGAGIVVQADGARLDASAAALLADRAAVEADLLAAADGRQVPRHGDGSSDG